MSATEAGLKLKSVPPRRMRAEVRPTCHQTLSGLNDGEPSSILHPPSSLLASAVRVRFGYWQFFPATMVMPPCGVPEKSGWKMRMFHLLDDLSATVVAGGTVSEATLRASGRPWQPVETVTPAEAAEMNQVEAAEQGGVPRHAALDEDFWMALHAAWDMAEEANLPMTITALEAALHLAKVQGRDAQANEAGVAQA